MGTGKNSFKKKLARIEAMEEVDPEFYLEAMIRYLKRTCFGCNTEFGMESEMEQHNKALHKLKSKGGEWFECETCKNRFKSKRELRVHCLKVPPGAMHLKEKKD